MRLLIAFVVGLFAAVTIFSATSPPVSAQPQPKKEQSTKIEKVYIKVKPGDSLSKIASKHKTTYKRIFYANKSIKNPDLIYPGEKLRIPNKGEKLKKRPMSAVQKVTAKVSDKAYRRYSKRSARKSQVRTYAPVRYSGGSSVWDRLAACESGGNWAINTGNGYYGGLQFTASTWRGVGGKGLPHQASKAEQIKRGKILQARSGWGQWPACTAKLGLR